LLIGKGVYILNILIALKKDISDSWCNFLSEKFKTEGIEANIIKQFTLTGTLEALEKKPIDVILTMEYLESNNRITTDYLNNLTDRFPDVNIILIIQNLLKGSSFLQELYNMGIYNALFEEDADYNNIIDLMFNPRTKATSREYYKLSKNNRIEDLAILTNEQLRDSENYLITGDLSAINDRYEYVSSKFNNTQNVYFINNISDSTKELLKDNEKYKYFLNISQIPTEVNSKSVIKEKVVEKEVVKEVVKEVEKKIFVVPSANQLTLGISFVSSEDNIGKTTIATSLACDFAEKEFKTAYIDLDLESKSYYYFTNEAEGYTLKEDFFTPNEIYPNLFVYIKNPKSSFKVDIQEIEDLLMYCRRNYNITIIDIPATMDLEKKKRILSYSEHTIIAATQEISFLDKMSEQLAELKETLTNSILVINKYKKSGDTKENISRKIERDIGIKLNNTYTILDDYEAILTAQRKGKPIIYISKAKELSDTFDKIVDEYLINHRTEKKKRFNLFNRKK